LTFGSSRLPGNYCHPILKPLRLLSIFFHFLESLSCLQFHTYPNFSLAGSRTGGVHFQCSLTCEQPPDLRDIQIDFRTSTSAPLPCYTVCTQKFRSIQFDRQGLTSPREPLSAYFEARPTAFHNHFLKSLSRIIRLAGSNNFQFLVTVFCARHLHTSFQVYAISI
jgi:hypothetical protein